MYGTQETAIMGNVDLEIDDGEENLAYRAAWDTSSFEEKVAPLDAAEAKCIEREVSFITSLIMTQAPETSGLIMGKWYTKTQSELDLLNSMQQTKRRGELIRLDDSEKRVVADIWRRKPSWKERSDSNLVADCIRSL